MTKEEAIKWLKHCAETDCDDCAYEIQPIEWCSEKMAYCVSVLEEALLEKSNDSKSFSDSAEIVRCKDCRHWNSETKGCKRNPSVEAWQEDDFCKYGERREP